VCLLPCMDAWLAQGSSSTPSGRVRIRTRIFPARARTSAHLRTQELWIGTPRTKGDRCRPEGDGSGQIWLKSVFDVRFIRLSTDRARPFRALKCCPQHLHTLFCISNRGGGPKGITRRFTVVQWLLNQSVNSQIHSQIHLSIK
jgi:hypothetical protein